MTKTVMGFDLDEIVELGDGRFIKRGNMTLEHIKRRQRFLDEQQANKEAAYRQEKDWIAKRMEESK